jgi:cytochrome c553
VVIPLAGLWFLAVAPARARELPIGGSAVIQIFVALGLMFSAFIFAFTYLGAFRESRRFGLSMALMLFTMGFLVTGTGEWVREGVRKPYIIGNYMYANSIRIEDVRRLNQEGVLANARWARVSAVTADNEKEAGQEVFRLICSSCHTVVGYNAVQPLVQGWDETYIDYQLQHLNELTDIMPRFVGTAEERMALAKWLAGLN